MGTSASPSGPPDGPVRPDEKPRRQPLLSVDQSNGPVGGPDGPERASDEALSEFFSEEEWALLHGQQSSHQSQPQPLATDRTADVSSRRGERASDECAVDEQLPRRHNKREFEGGKTETLI